MLVNTPNLLKKSVFEQQIQSLFDYRCVLALGDPVLLLSCGVSFILQKKTKKISNLFVFLF